MGEVMSRDSIAKEAPKTEENVQVTESNHKEGSVSSFRGIPLDLMDHFGIGFDSLGPKTQDMLRDIHRMLDGDDLRSKFDHLYKIQLKLGKNGSRPIFDRVWNWLKINNNIKSQRTKQDKGYLGADEAIAMQEAKQKALETI